MALTPTPVNGLELRGVSKRLGAVDAVRELDLSVAEGELVTLLGPSGSGKTTTLNLVAGFLAADAGSIRLRGRALDGIAPEKRDIGIVFQSYVLFPHLTVAENVAFPLRRRRVPRAQARRRALEMLALVELEARADAKPGELSGGQQQRVALARALVFEPRLVLLDEPLSALDRRLRHHLQEQLRELHRRLGFTALYVTHDQEEALSLSDRVAIMHEGRLVQVGTGEELYRRPATLFAARFLGEANVAAGEVLAAAGADRVTVALRTDAPPLTVAAAAGADRPGAAVAVVVRPEDLRVVAADAPGPCFARGRLRERVFLGQDVLSIVVSDDRGEVRVRERPGLQDPRCQVGEPVAVRLCEVAAPIAVAADRRAVKFRPRGE